MATKLKNMKLTSVDLVKAGANQNADICLFKSADNDGSESTTEKETSILKRFINWLRENPVEPENDHQDGIEKSEDDIGYADSDIEDIYKSAITESIQSIVADETLSAEEKNDMIAKSIDQYHEKMAELYLEKYDDDPDDMSYIYEGLEKSEPDYDLIEEI